MKNKGDDSYKQNNYIFYNKNNRDERENKK